MLNKVFFIGTEDCLLDGIILQLKFMMGVLRRDWHGYLDAEPH